MSAWKIILATLLIFGSGFVAGALLVKRGNHVASHVSAPVISSNSPAPAPWHLQRMDFLRRMEKQLDLTPEQHQRIETIIRESQERTKPLWEEIGPQLREELQRVREQIQSELPPEQRQKFQELLKPRPPRKPPESTPPEERRRRQPPPPDGSGPAPVQPGRDY